MLPTNKQYQKWSLPAKWTFWAGIMAILSLVLGVAGLIPSNDDSAEVALNKLTLQVAQELRYNTEWLSELSISYENNSVNFPIGRMKVDALVLLANSDFEKIIKHSYGEEKYIYQDILKLNDLAEALGSPTNAENVNVFNSKSKYYHLHDVLFLNEFLRWYLRPLIEEKLTSNQLYTLGWKPFPDSEFDIHGVNTIKLKYFVYDDKPISEFVDYLGLID